MEKSRDGLYGHTRPFQTLKQILVQRFTSNVGELEASVFSDLIMQFSYGGDTTEAMFSKVKELIGDILDSDYKLYMGVKVNGKGFSGHLKDVDTFSLKLGVPGYVTKEFPVQWGPDGPAVVALSQACFEYMRTVDIPKFVRKVSRVVEWSEVPCQNCLSQWCSHSCSHSCKRRRLN